MARKGFVGLGLGLIACVLALLLWQEGVLVGFERATWQWRVAYFARPTPATSQLRIIALDQKSLDWGRKENGLSWPWPRQAYATLLAFCKRAGVRAVAFDLLFSEPSLYGVGDDQMLGQAMQENGPVVLSYTFAPAGEGQTAHAARPSLLTISGFSQWLAGRQGAGGARAVTMPVPELGDNAALLANISNRPDPDGVFRRVPLFIPLAGHPVPSLALATYLAGTLGPVELALGKNRLQVGELAVPIDATGHSILNFRGPSGTIKTISLAAVVQSELQLEAGEAPVVDPADFKDAYVFFGMTAPGLYDLRATPTDGVYPGVEIHATMLDNLLSQDFLRDSPVWLAASLTLFFGVLASLSILFCRNAWQSSLAFVIFLPLPLLSGFIAYGLGVWLPVAVQTTAVLLALISGVVFNLATEGRKKRYIKRAFSQYLHPTVIEQLVSNPALLRLGGEKRELSIFFSDLAGFTTMSERLDPERLTLLLNEYLSAMTDIILASGGTIDKYEGDAIIAFWNAPLTQNDHAARAVRSALHCQERLAGLRPDFKARFGCDLFMRIGINTGSVVVGNLGSSQRFDYSILGDSANVAARLEGVNKEFGTEILISEACRNQLPGELQVREIGRVGVVGRKEPITVFEPLALQDAGKAERISRFAAALARYYRGEISEARAAFQELAADDGVSARYAARCRELLDNPPLAWDGVWRMGSK
ncbi:CHASE2 domain-containing protein [Thiovibrio frasassiensis]|uniref:Adenylate/guanylate cyclase domain-containing protein n=1 Tax=Thiovibrio frasassiensis TaxID=2984131 RepID=A0A9X4RLF4_9BACT|nr:adenylate/guanylate cyclase domain-containing protein [Thiovibrio frasassiensis]MDG4475073.1 adenylate/guanylate cyclase domain-containing protein [Thiovibrio frasassiensis]